MKPHQNLSTVKYGSGSIMIWGYFSPDEAKLLSFLQKKKKILPSIISSTRFLSLMTRHYSNVLSGKESASETSTFLISVYY